MAKKNPKSGVLGVLILLIGVIIGLVLVRQTQDFRNSAKENKVKTYTVCHRVGVTDNRWEEITVTTEELSTRLNQGDIFGKCPENVVK